MRRALDNGLLVSGQYMGLWDKAYGKRQGKVLDQNCAHFLRLPKKLLPFTMDPKSAVHTEAFLSPISVALMPDLRELVRLEL